MRDFVAHHREHEAAATVLTAMLDDPAGYGRIVRDEDGNLLRIVEEQGCRPRRTRDPRDQFGTVLFFDAASCFPR